MHPYATDSVERKTIPLYLVAVSILAAFLLHKILEGVIPWWIDVPSVAGFYGLFYLAFEKLLWRMHFLSSLGLVQVPNLNGKWSGYVTSSFDKHASTHDGTLEIHQSWTELSICLQTERSKSFSLIGTVTTENPAAGSLSYEYINEPRADALASMHTHRGLARFDLTALEDRWILEGEYYSGRDRRNFGILHFEREIKKV
jgi:hypothetical protein